MKIRIDFDSLQPFLTQNYCVNCPCVERNSNLLKLVFCVYILSLGPFYSSHKFFRIALKFVTNWYAMMADWKKSNGSENPKSELELLKINIL